MLQPLSPFLLLVCLHSRPWMEPTTLRNRHWKHPHRHTSNVSQNLLVMKIHIKPQWKLIITRDIWKQIFLFRLLVRCTLKGSMTNFYCGSFYLYPAMWDHQWELGMMRFYTFCCHTLSRIVHGKGLWILHSPHSTKPLSLLFQLSTEFICLCCSPM